MTDVYDAIPKVEIHCHVEGTLRPATAFALARKAGRPFPVEDPSAIFRYRSLDDFLRVFWVVQQCLETPDDWARAAYESMVDGAAHGLRYREMFFTPARHLAAGQQLRDIVAGLTAGIAAAERETGARCVLICDCDRSFGPQAASELVNQLDELRTHGGAEKVIGFGMDSTELGVDLRTYADAFAAAKRRGLRRAVHAGEDGGPENIAIAVDILGAERIDHGLAILSDPVLASRLAQERIPLTVCPSSNVLIANKYRRLEDHPYRAMREAGLLATVNTDDPGMIDLDLGKEYREVARAFRFDLPQMAEIALDGVEASWLDPSEKARVRAEFERELRTVRATA